MNTRNFVIIMHGPTGVGKTECADYIATLLPVEIINSDMGQLYTPLTIGTAKPSWRTSEIPHHLFDVLSEPELYSVKKYREQLKRILHTIWDKQKIPLIIGGSSYYVMSLFFPPVFAYPGLQARQASPGKPLQPDHKKDGEIELFNNKDLWNKLYEIDPERAQAIDPADTYRIARALEIWQHTGIKPSVYKPVYDPIADYYFIWITRDRDELYKRINERVIEMLDAGWIEEVKALRGTEWEPFLRKKKIIGYGDVLDYFEGKISHESMVSMIQKRTRNYAKRQITFWRMLKAKLENALKSSNADHRVRSAIGTLNLTDSGIERYSEQLKQTVKELLS